MASTSASAILSAEYDTRNESSDIPVTDILDSFSENSPLVQNNDILNSSLILPPAVPVQTNNCCQDRMSTIIMSLFCVFTLLICVLFVIILGYNGFYLENNKVNFIQTTCIKLDDDHVKVLYPQNFTTYTDIKEPIYQYITNQDFFACYWDPCTHLENYTWNQETYCCQKGNISECIIVSTSHLPICIDPEKDYYDILHKEILIVNGISISILVILSIAFGYVVKTYVCHDGTRIV